MKMNSKKITISALATIFVLVCIAVYNHPIVKQIRFVKWFASRPPQFYEEYSRACDLIIETVVADDSQYGIRHAFKPDRLYIPPEDIYVPHILQKKHLKSIILGTNGVGFAYWSYDRGAYYVAWRHTNDSDGTWNLTGGSRKLYSRKKTNSTHTTPTYLAKKIWEHPLAAEKNQE